MTQPVRGNRSLVSDQTGLLPAGRVGPRERGRVLDVEARDVDAGDGLQALEAGRAVHLHDLRSLPRLEHVDARHLEPDDADGLHGRLGIFARELDGLALAAAVQVRAELALARGAPHRSA